VTKLDKAVRRIEFYTRKVAECGDRSRWVGRWEARARRSQRLIAYKPRLNAWLKEQPNPFRQT